MSSIRAARGTVLYSPGPLGFVARRARPRALVLAYHRVADTTSDPYNITVSTLTFERHLRLLKRHWNVVALDVLVDRMENGTCHDSSIAVTFDDGYADNLETAAPIAAALGVPLTVFVTAGPVLDGEPLFWWDALAEATAGPVREVLHPALRRVPAPERSRIIRTLAMTPPSSCGRPMTTTELRMLARIPGITIGSHTMTHSALGALPAAEQQVELQSSKERLEDAVGRPITLMSYPFGQRADISADTIVLAMTSGYRAAFTATGRAIVPGENPHALSRVIVHECNETALSDRIGQVLRQA